MRAITIVTQASLLALLGIIFTAFLFCTGPGRAVASMVQKSS
jgi:hypothetical protein